MTASRIEDPPSGLIGFVVEDALVSNRRRVLIDGYHIESFDSPGRSPNWSQAVESMQASLLTVDNVPRSWRWGVGSAVRIAINPRTPRLETDLLSATWWPSHAGADGTRVEATRLPLPRDSGDKLRRLSLLPQAHEVREATIIDLLASITDRSPIEAVAAYDVGQAAACALVCGVRPNCYFDLGIPTRLNPPLHAQPSFCWADNPPVILSHWDSDHWAGAELDTRSLDSPWLVPNQWLSPTATRFAARLIAHGNLLVWPPGVASASAGPLIVERCTKSGGDRNHTGLALTVHGPAGQSVLLPGDAGYRWIPSSSAGKLTLTSLVASHHGAKRDMWLARMPRPDGRPEGRIVYSYGDNNVHAHPNPSAVAKYRATGWRTELRTPLQAPGNIHLYWDQASVAVSTRCARCTCTLGPSKR